MQLDASTPCAQRKALAEPNCPCIMRLFVSEFKPGAFLSNVSRKEKSMGNDSTADDHALVGNLPPQIAQQLGVFVAVFGSLEFMLARILAVALGEDNKCAMSWSICNRIQSIHHRSLAIKDCLEKSPHIGDTKREKATSFIDEILTVNAKRNEYVHGIWQGTKTGSTFLTPYVTTADRKKTRREVKQGEIAREIDAIIKLCGKIDKELFPQDLNAL
jgi:hypothetical protein